MGDSIRDMRGGDWAWFSRSFLRIPLTWKAKVTYMALVYFANGDSQSCFPKKEALATLTGTGKTTIYEGIEELKKASVIDVKERIGDSGKTSNEYILLPIPFRNTETDVRNTNVPHSPRERTPIRHANVINENKEELEEVNETVIMNASKKGKFTEEQIETLYQAYPRKVAHAPALKAICKALEGIEKSSKSSSGEVFEWLLGTVKAYAGSVSGRRPSGTDYRPHPATWFNQERYFDDPQDWNRTGGTTNGRVEQNKDAARIVVERIAARARAANNVEASGNDQFSSGSGQPGLFGDHGGEVIEGKR